MHGQSAHLDASSSVERYTICVSTKADQSRPCNKRCSIDTSPSNRLRRPKDSLTCAGPLHAFLGPSSRSDITDIATASWIIGGAVDEITIQHTIGRPHASKAGLGRLSSSTAAPAIDLHVSSGNQQQQQHQRCSPKLSKQQQPPSPLLTPQARLGCFSRARRLTVGCASNIYETLLSELRSSIRRGRSGRIPR